MVTWLLSIGTGVLTQGILIPKFIPQCPAALTDKFPLFIYFYILFKS